MSQPLVSIVMPIYNGAVFLSQTLESVAAQTYVNWELIVIDDGSTDNSSSIITQFRDKHPNCIRLINSTKPKSGPSVCRNMGISNASGCYIIFLDSDDLLSPICLQKRVEIMHAMPQLDWAVFMQYSLVQSVESNLNLPLFSKPNSNVEDAIRSFLEMEPPWQTMASIWRKKVLIEIGGFDEELIYMEDPDLHLRALLDSRFLVKICSDLPPDCFYRLNVMDASKHAVFYNNSISSRIKFLEKYIINIEYYFLISKYDKVIRDGFFRFLKFFVVARIQNYHLDIAGLIGQLYKRKILSRVDLIKLRLVILIYKSNGFWVSTLRLKGFVYSYLLI